MISRSERSIWTRCSKRSTATAKVGPPITRPDTAAAADDDDDTDDDTDIDAAAVDAAGKADAAEGVGVEP